MTGVFSPIPKNIILFFKQIINIPKYFFFNFIELFKKNQMF